MWQVDLQVQVSWPPAKKRGVSFPGPSTLLTGSKPNEARDRTLVIGVGRKGGESPRETGLATIPKKVEFDVPAITDPPKVQPWKDWLQAEMAASSDPNRPWLDWKPNMDDPSDKPWLHWNKRKLEQGLTGVCEAPGKGPKPGPKPRPNPDPEPEPKPKPEPVPKPGPTAEMMGTYPVINLARI
ncbi:hypothetical protein CEP52_004426 [Fusarium oligoseptatum]|uniref:Uncharacterized protein n=1 Tax=Fusarium oligoseptatum TaxID=2604345 RepID=A0A428U3Z9_9HYPO|nr:hypothetical protein CEP52_004426 [Fusarium oligoseptatum]